MNGFNQAEGNGNPKPSLRNYYDVALRLYRLVGAAGHVPIDGFRRNVEALRAAICQAADGYDVSYLNGTFNLKAREANAEWEADFVANALPLLEVLNKELPHLKNALPFTFLRMSYVTLKQDIENIVRDEAIKTDVRAKSRGAPFEDIDPAFRDESLTPDKDGAVILFPGAEGAQP